MSLPTPVNEETAAGLAAEIGSELHRSLDRHLHWALRAWRETLAHVEKKQVGYVSPGERDDLAALRENTQFAINAFERIGQGDPVWLEHQTPAEYSWNDITNEMTRDEAAGWALWAKVRQTARDDLASGIMAGQAIEGFYPRPYERAAFLAVREALADGLQPRNKMELLLVDGLAQTWTLYLRWQDQQTDMNSTDALRTGRDRRQRDGWEPPRVGEAEAVDRAVQMADRFQRQFLRLLKAYRDQRRLFGTVVVASGQVNIATAGGQMIVANGEHEP